MKRVYFAILVATAMTACGGGSVEDDATFCARWMSDHPRPTHGVAGLLWEESIPQECRV